MTSMLSIFECIIRSSSVSLEESKVIAIVNLFSTYQFFLRLFSMPLKYSLILLKYSSTDSVLFLSQLLLYPI